MSQERSREEIIKRVQSLAKEAIANSHPTAWFELLYSQANGNENNVPWAKLTPHPFLVDWLKKYQKNDNPNKSTLVVGCGLGDDAEALAELGYKVTAFDISETAIAWCKKRFPDTKVDYLVADLFSLDPAWDNSFDFVFESRTIQALPIDIRENVTRAIAKLVADKGTLLVITRYRDTETKPEGPPWAVSELELSQFARLGLQEIRRDLYVEAGKESIKQFRIEYLNSGQV